MLGNRSGETTCTHSYVYAGTLWVCGASMVLGRMLPTTPARAMLRGVSCGRHRHGTTHPRTRRGAVASLGWRRGCWLT